MSHYQPDHSRIELLAGVAARAANIMQLIWLQPRSAFDLREFTGDDILSPTVDRLPQSPCRIDPSIALTDYNLEYHKGPERCGPVFEEFERFLVGLAPASAILDLGCGQGRDTVVAGRLGHSVVAVDTAESGLMQLRHIARLEELSIETVRADIREFTTDAEFDVVILDRVLHILGGPSKIHSILNRVPGWTLPGGWALVADTRKNRATIRAHFRACDWTPELERGDLLISRKPRLGPA